jgi:TonB family protein
MSDVVRLLSSTGADLVAFAWLPLLIWTILAVTVLGFLRISKNLHVQYHYHARLALLAALPAGLILAGLTDLVAGWISAGEEAIPLKFIIVSAPVEMTITEPETASLLLSPSFWYGLGMFLILAGVLLLFIRHFTQYVQLNILSKKLELKPIRDIEEVSYQNKKLARDCGKPVAVAYLEQAVIPVTFGVRRPVVLLPLTLINDMEKMNLVLRHELFHIRNRDYLVHLMMTGVRILFWFHPVVHLLYHQLIEYRELRCDSHVLSDDSISRKKYASVLLDLLPMPNLNNNVSVNMAQESSNIKKRITMMQTNTIRSIPVRTSLALFGSVILAVVLVMSCTDMQQHNVLDEEDLDLMTNLDRTGERGYHEIIIMMSDENQADRHDESISRLEALQPEYIESINVLKGDAAIEKYGPRGAEGVLEIRTRQDIDSYNRTLRALGMEPVDPSDFPEPGQETDEDFYVVVEEMPELIGGLASVQTNIRYPEMARRAGIEGRVYVQFIVNEEGNVENAQIIRGIGGGADEEALRVVNEAKFRPGMQRGQPVRVLYSLPIIFKLAGNSPDEQVDVSEHKSNNNEPEQDTSVLPETVVVGYENTSENGTPPEIEIESPEVIQNSMRIENFQQTGNAIRGTVLDANTGQPLAGANIILTGSNRGTVTNVEGSFSLSNVQTDSTELQISYIGYETARLEL